MKTDKLFYRIFLTQPSLIRELLPEIPIDCQFEYSAPVVKEKEIRLDGLLTPVEDNPNLPLIFLEAQMQKDSEFYSRYFAGLFLYLHQYKIKQSWRGLIIINDPSLDLGVEIPYQDLLNYRVKRFYLSDLLNQENLSPNLSLLKLVIIPENEALSSALKILKTAENEAEFKLKLDLVEAILVNKFPKLTIEEVQKMLNLKEADVTQTRFYQQVLQRGEANMVIRLLNHRCGNLSPIQEEKIKSLSSTQL